MKALIDADILPYEFGGMVQLEDPEKPLEWAILRSLVDERIASILKAVGRAEAVDGEFFLTDSSSNFRIETATIVPYKGHRAQEKPYHWEKVRQHIIDAYGGSVQRGIEADDRLGIDQCGTAAKYLYSDHPEPWIETIICSRDKDLNMIPGWHYQWECGKQKEKLWFQDETEAIRCFYRQLLTGDSTDNILGLFGVGNSSTLVKKIDEFVDERDMLLHVYAQYKNRFGSYAWQFLIENAKLLWILREEPVIVEETEWHNGSTLGGQEIYNRLEVLSDGFNL